MRLMLRSLRRRPGCSIRNAAASLKNESSPVGAEPAVKKLKPGVCKSDVVCLNASAAASGGSGRRTIPKSSCKGSIGIENKPLPVGAVSAVEKLKPGVSKSDVVRSNANAAASGGGECTVPKNICNSVVRFENESSPGDSESAVKKSKPGRSRSDTVLLNTNSRASGDGVLSIPKNSSKGSIRCKNDSLPVDAESAVKKSQPGHARSKIVQLNPNHRPGSVGGRSIQKSSCNSSIKFRIELSPAHLESVVKKSEPDDSKSDIAQSEAKPRASSDGGRMPTRASTSSAPTSDLAATPAAPVSICSQTQTSIMWGRRTIRSNPSMGLSRKTNASAACILSSLSELNRKETGSKGLAVSESNCKEIGQKGSSSMEDTSEQRILRPRRPGRVNCSELKKARKPFVDLELSVDDGMSIVGRRIKVWWPLDDCWYYGFVRKYDGSRNTHCIIYDDGDEEWLHLGTERCKLQVKPEEVSYRSRSQQSISFRNSLLTSAPCQDRLVENNIINKCTQSAIDGAEGGEPYERSETLEHALECANDEVCNSMNADNLQEDNDRSLMNSCFIRDLDRNGKCVSSFQSPHKVTNVYSRRHSRSKHREHGMSSYSLRQKPFHNRLALASSASREHVLSNKLETQCHHQVLEAANRLHTEHSIPDSVTIVEKINSLTCKRSIDASCSTMSHENLSPNSGAPFITHATELCLLKLDNQPDVYVGKTDKSSLANHITLGAPSECTGDTPNNFYKGSSISSWKFRKMNHSEDTSPSHRIDTSTKPEGNDAKDVVMDRDPNSFEDGDLQLTTHQTDVEELECPEYVRFQLGQFYPQRISLNLVECLQVVLNAIGQEFQLLELVQCEDMLRCSFVDQRRRKSPSGAHYGHELEISQSFQANSMRSVLLKLHPSQLVHSMVPMKLMEMLHRLKGQLLSCNGRSGCDAMLYNEGDRSWSFRRCDSCPHMPQHSYSSAEGLHCNKWRFSAASVTNKNILQVELGINLSPEAKLMRVICVVFDCLQFVLRSLEELINNRIIFHGWRGLRYTGSTFDKAGLHSTRPFLLTPTQGGGEFGASVFVLRPQKLNSVARSGRYARGKNNYVSNMETAVSKIPINELLQPYLEQTWKSLSGTVGFHFGYSQIVSFNMVRNAAFSFRPSPSCPASEDDMETLGQLLESVRRSGKISCSSDVQSLCSSRYFHVNKRRRSDKVLKGSILSSKKVFAEDITCVDLSLDGRDGLKRRKRRKLCAQRFYRSANAGRIQKFVKDQNEQIHSSSAPNFEENVVSRLHPKSPADSTKVFNSLEHTGCEDKKANKLRQVDTSVKTSTPKIMLNLDFMMVHHSSKDLAGDSSTSADASTFCSSPPLLHTIVSNQDIKLDSKQQEHYQHMGFGGPGDDSQQDRRKRRKTGHYFVLERQRKARDAFGRNAFFSCDSPIIQGELVFEQMHFKTLETKCFANILYVQDDRGWREFDATVELFSDGNTWVLSICHNGKVLFLYKVEQPVASGATNRYTHSMIWKGGSVWSLEFEDRRQWVIFKELHQMCFHRNTKAATVRQIPIPGINQVLESSSLDASEIFVRPHHYIYQKQGELDAALSCNKGLYDMDSEDEEWLDHENRVTGTGSSFIITDETVEAAIGKLEKASYLNHEDVFSADVAVELCKALGPVGVIKSIHRYWIGKRLRKGMPLVRHFQPAPWEQYQKQLHDWEEEAKSIQKDSITIHKSSSAEWPPRPPGFAFCLRPKGLDAPNKVQKQRSQKKLSSGGAFPRHWASAIASTPAMDSLVGSPVDPHHGDEHLEEPLIGGTNSPFQAFWEDPCVGSCFFGGDKIPTMKGGKVRPKSKSNLFCDRPITGDTSLFWRSSGSGKQSWKIRKIGRRAKKKRAFSMGKEFFPNCKGKSEKGFRSLQNVAFPENVRSQVLEGYPLPSTLKASLLSKIKCVDPVVNSGSGSTFPCLEMNLEAVALAKADSARKAASLAAHKRAKAQALYAVADAAMHDAVSAVIAAEAIEAHRKDSLNLNQNFNEVSFAPHFERVRKSRPDGGDSPKKKFQNPQKTLKTFRNMVLGGPSPKRDFVNSREDALLPIASWSEEIGAGLGTKLINTGESLQKDLEHSLPEVTVPNSSPGVLEDLVVAQL